MLNHKHRIEASLVHLSFSICKLLPLDVASAIGGEIGQLLGPFLSAHKTAQRNLSLIMPQLSKAEKRNILRGMWNNLGRVAAEFPHLTSETMFSRIEVHGVENIATGGKPSLFLSGHLGNWELLMLTAFRHGTPLTLIYRQANNIAVDTIIGELRRPYLAGMFPKGLRGSVKMARAIKSGASLGFLVDQKMNDGISVPFMGRDAMTSVAAAQMALRYDMPILLARCERIQGAHFKVTIDTPLHYEKTGDTEKDTLTIMTLINKRLEEWVVARPEQWFWVHKRWPKE